MNSSPKLPTKHPDRVAEPLAGGCVVSASLPGKGGSFRLGGVDGGGGGVVSGVAGEGGVGVKGKYKYKL